MAKLRLWTLCVILNDHSWNDEYSFIQIFPTLSAFKVNNFWKRTWERKGRALKVNWFTCELKRASSLTLFSCINTLQNAGCIGISFTYLTEEYISNWRFVIIAFCPQCRRVRGKNRIPLPLEVIEGTFEMRTNWSTRIDKVHGSQHHDISWSNPRRFGLVW